jgi:hypothetical protein
MINIITAREEVFFPLDLEGEELLQHCYASTCKSNPKIPKR